MKFETYYLERNCFSDCKTDMQECENDVQGAMVYFEDLRKVISCMDEVKAYAIQMDWFSKSGEVNEDTPGWVSLMANLNEQKGENCK